MSGWSAGQRIEIGSELMLVKENDPINKIAAVVRGWLSTEIVNHPVDSAIFVKPRMLRSDIIDLINDCLDDMYGRELYAVGTKEITYNSAIIGYDLDSEAIKILRVDALHDSASDYWKPVFDFYLVDNAGSDFPSGKALMTRAALPFSAKIRVLFSKAFNQISSEADDLEVVAGIRPYMKDLLYYFAMNRLMVDAERKRSQIEAAQSHQRAQDVPPFLALRTGEWYQARYEDRVRTARKRLKDESERAVATGYGS